jgi:hypothetical protein
MNITRLEFDDPDDPESPSHPSYGGGIRLQIAPEGAALLLPNGRELTQDDQSAMAALLRLAYAQGKHVGKLCR